MLRIGIATLAITMALPAQAEEVQWVNAPRISFGDAVPRATQPLASLDLGAAPPPGSSRLFSRDELRTFALQAHAPAADLEIPASVRIKRTSHRFSAKELESIVRPVLTARLPQGASLTNMVLPNTFLSVPDLRVGEVQMPRLPKRVGTTRITAVLELVAAGALVSRLPVPVDVQLDERATLYDLPRGATLNLVIESGSTRVSATATLINPADIGDVVPCQVLRTRKVLRAKVLTHQEASVVQP